MSGQLPPDPQALFEPKLRETLAMLAHDLRTPLHGIMGFLDLLSHSDMDAAQRGSLTGARMCGEDLLETLNGILEGVNLDTGGLTVNDDWVDLRALFSDMAGVFAPQAALHGIRFHWSVNSGVPPWWRCDRCKLRQILANLLGNALKFTPSGGISIDAGWDGEEPGALVIRVKDTGSGIPDDDLNVLLDAHRPQVRLRRGRNAGNGLGLAIVQRLTALMGGSVRLSSASGQGTEVRLRFPWECREHAAPGERRPVDPRPV